MNPSLFRAALAGLLAAFLLAILLTRPCDAQDASAGDGALAYAYCADVEALKAVSDAIMADAIEGSGLAAGYLSVMSDRGVLCADAALYDVPVVLVTLRESLWSVSPAEGVTVRFWRAELSDGSAVFTWSKEERGVGDLRRSEGA